MNTWKNRLLAAALAPLLLAGCKTTGAKIAASAFTGTGDTFARDDDPELVRDAIPFALKTMEALLDTIPDDVGLLRALSANFTQYGYAFVQTDADVAEMEGKVAAAGPAVTGPASSSCAPATTACAPSRSGTPASRRACARPGTSGRRSSG